jgi:hypothetical protein
MNGLIGFAHVSVLEDLFYIFWDEAITVKSYRPHYVRVNAEVENVQHLVRLIEKADGYIYTQVEDCDNAFEEDPLTN